MVLRTLPTKRRSPSHFSQWEGEAVAGSPWTRQQLKTLAEDRPGRKDFEGHPVKLQPEQTRIDEPPPPPFYITCPVLARGKGGTRVLIVTPAGFKAWVNANG